MSDFVVSTFIRFSIFPIDSGDLSRLIHIERKSISAKSVTTSINFLKKKGQIYAIHETI